MIRKLIPVVMALIGLGGGLAAGMALRPGSTEDGAHDTAVAAEAGHDAPAGGAGHDGPAADAGAGAGHEGEAGDPSVPDYVKLNNQFIVPVLEDGRVASMVILSLSLEVTQGSSEAVYAREPKLRDVFLQAMFDHANAGGFRGTFTDGSNLVLLRKALLEVARSTLGEAVSDVLIVDIVRQDS